MRVHFIGIGGIGVSALAQYYLARGHEVSGSDLNSSEITQFLQRKGAKIHIGPHLQRTVLCKFDLVVYSPAVQENNPELKEARRIQVSSGRLLEQPAGQAGFKFQILSYPQALGDLTKQYFTIAVSGTHGKSTTTAMIGLILVKAGLDPTVIIGTKVKEFGSSNFRAGGRPKNNIARTLLRGRNVLIIEADEHFASFLNYWPRIIVLTNIERDHLDYYKNLKNILKAFKEYISRLPEDGWLVANKDDGNIRKILNPKSQIPNTIFYSLKQKEAKKLRKILKLPGEHNLSNALAALALARVLKIPDKVSFKALSEYKGSWRRFEIKKVRFQVSPKGSLRLPTGQAGFRFQVVSDYGHHPTEIAATCQAAREKWPRKKIWLVFQPHQYQRTFYLFKDFVNVFREALACRWIDKAVITDIYDVAGREEKKIKKAVTAGKLADKIKKENVIYLPKGKILPYLEKSLKGKEIVIIMGAGDIYKLSEQL